MNSTHLRGWLVILLITVALFSFSTRNYTPKHSIYNEGELGTSHLRSTLETDTNLTMSRILISPFGLQSADEIELIIIIGSERKYTQAEISAYKNFVENGGNLIIFEDFGHARDIAASMDITFFDGVLRETFEDITVNRPTQFLVQDLTTELFGYESDIFIMVNEAAGISDILGLTRGTTFPLLVSFPTTFIDRDNDNVQDRNDLRIQFGTPLGLFKQVGDGYLAVISDASIPLNMYHNLNVQIGETLYSLPNIWWSSLMIQTMALFANTTSIVFDESHQQIVWSSSSGLLNLLASTWVGIFNSANLVLGLFLLVIIFAILLNRDVYGKIVGNVRQARKSKVTTHQFVSNPTLAERGVSEQYILYQRMGTGFLQIANLELYNQIKATDKGEKFLDELKEEYGKITQSRNVSELLEIHGKMRDFVNEELAKWL